MREPISRADYVESFVAAMSEASLAAIRQGISFDEALARAGFDLDAHYAAAGLPTDTSEIGADDAQ